MWVIRKITEVNNLYAGYTMLKGATVSVGYIPYTTIILGLFFLFIVVKLKKEKNKKLDFLIFATFVYFLIRIFTSFEVDGTNTQAIMSRFAHYWSYHFIVLITVWMMRIKRVDRKKYILFTTMFILVLSFQSLNGLNNEMFPKTPNSNYQFNFNILK